MTPIRIAASSSHTQSTSQRDWKKARTADFFACKAVQITSKKSLRIIRCKNRAIVVARG
jgi:hypothetical protein